MIAGDRNGSAAVDPRNQGTSTATCRSEKPARRAKKEMVEANLRLSVISAKKYTNCGPCSSGFDPGRQHRPDEGGRQVRIPPAATSFDLCHLVDPAITRSIADQARTIRIPGYDRNHQQAEPGFPQMLQEMGPRADSEELAKAHGDAGGQGAQVLKIAKEPISMETPIGDDEDSHLGDFYRGTS